MAISFDNIQVFPLNESNMQAIEEQVKSGDYKLARRLVTSFTGYCYDPADNPFLYAHPEICVRFLPILRQGVQVHQPKDKQRKIKQIGISEHTAKRVLDTFIQTKVFSTKALKEIVEFVTSDGIVKINEEIIYFNSATIRGLWHCPPGTKEADMPYQLQRRFEVSSPITKMTVEHIKNWLYFRAWPEITIQEAIPIVTFADLYGMPELVSFCSYEMQKKMSDMKNNKEFDMAFFEFSKKLPLDSSERKACELAFVEMLLSHHRIDFIKRTTKLLLPLSQWFRLESQDDLSRLICHYSVGFIITARADKQLLSQLHCFPPKTFEIVTELHLNETGANFEEKQMKTMFKIFPKCEKFSWQNLCNRNQQLINDFFTAK